MSLVGDQLEDPKSQPLLEVRNVELPQLSLEFSKLVAHVDFKLVPSGIGSGQLMSLMGCPPLDDLKVVSKLVDLVLGSCQSIPSWGS